MLVGSVARRIGLLVLLFLYLLLDKELGLSDEKGRGPQRARTDLGLACISQESGFPSPLIGLGGPGLPPVATARLALLDGRVEELVYRSLRYRCAPTAVSPLVGGGEVEGEVLRRRLSEREGVRESEQGDDKRGMSQGDGPMRERGLDAHGSQQAKHILVVVFRLAVLLLLLRRRQPARRPTLILLLPMLLLPLLRLVLLVLLQLPCHPCVSLLLLMLLLLLLLGVTLLLLLLRLLVPDEGLDPELVAGVLSSGRWRRRLLLVLVLKLLGMVLGVMLGKKVVHREGKGRERAGC